jgi:spermidine synthase
MSASKNIQIGETFIQRILFFLFGLSGFCGLIYESIWTHYLKLFLGCAAYAQTLVLVIFMGGMALGAWGIGRFSGKIRNLLIGYAVVEASIGVAAVLFHSIYTSATDYSYFTLIPKLDSVALLFLYKWGLAALLILPQTVLLGATFPLMSAGLIRLFPQTPGRTLSLLYFSNSIGAVAGVLASGYLLIGLVGLPGTVLAAGLINLSIALFVWLISHNEDRGRIPLTDAKARQTAGSRKILVALLWCSCLTGAASFLYEIGWIRMLCLVLGSSTHAFELMLSAFILGLALGGYWIRRSIDSLKNPIRSLGVIQVLMGVLALSTLLWYGGMFDFMGLILSGLSRSLHGYFLFNLFSQSLCLMIMLPATVCAGMTLPLITFHLISNGHGEGAIGKTYAANTAGAILGVLLGVQLIMPWLGLKNVILIGSAIDASLGLVLLWHSGRRFQKAGWPWIAGLCAVFYAFAVFGIKLDISKMASGVFRTGQSRTNATILFHKDGRSASVDLLRSYDPNQIIIETNGKPDASIGVNEVSPDDPTQVLVGALGCAVHPDLKHAAVIGMGSGMTSHVLLTQENIKSLDLVEIEPAMVEAAKGFGERISNTFNDPRCHITIEDAKTFFTNRRKKYDLIISEPSNPWVSGVSGLFSREFYGLIRRYLAEDGLLVQWLQLYEISTPLVASVMKSLSEKFEDYDVYFSSNGDLIILAGKRVQGRPLQSALFHSTGMRSELFRIGVTSVQDLRLRHLGGKKMLDPFFKSYEIAPNSDFFPILDLNAVRDRFMNNSSSEIINIRKIAAPLTEVLNGEPPPEAPLDVTQADYFDTGRDARQAMAIHQYFKHAGGKAESVSIMLKSNSLMMIRNVRSIRDQCRLEELGEGWLPWLDLLASATLPYLSPKEMEVIWKDIQSSRCYSSLPDSIRNWVELYKAVGARNYKGMLKYSVRMMPPGLLKPSQQMDYLLTVSMLAQLALKDESAAADLCNRYTNRENPPVAIRLLKSIACPQDDEPM